MRDWSKFKTMDDAYGDGSKHLVCVSCGRFPLNVITTRNKVYNESYNYNGVDRRNNLLGYTKENCVTCCEICNRAKKDLPLEEFFAWIHRLIEYNI